MKIKLKPLVTTESDWTDGLSVRARNCLSYLGVKTKQDAIDTFTAAGFNPLVSVPCYGWKTHLEIAKRIGMKRQQKRQQMKKVKRLLDKAVRPQL